MSDADKPLLRGWSHVVACLACFPATWALLQHARAGEPTLAAFVFMAGLILLFGISGIYHRVKWSERGLARMRRVDHGMIFVSVTAFYTPFCLLALPPSSGPWLLLAVSIGSALGILRVLMWPYAPRWAAVASYVVVCSFAMPVLGVLEQHLSPLAIACVTLGFTSAGLGGLCYALGKPEVWPGVLGHHEVFHLAVIVCGACYYTAVWTLVAG